jgi:hypothetical protein
VKLIRGTWPVLAAGYVIQLISGTIMMATAWSVTRIMPRVDFDPVSAFNPDRLLQLVSTYLGTIGLAFIWISVAATVSYLMFIFFTGGVLGGFRSWAREGRGFEVDSFLRSGFTYLGPLLALNMLLLALFMAIGLVATALSLAFAFTAGALAMNSDAASGFGLMLILMVFITLLPLLAGFFLFLASGVASARLVWDDLPVLTSLRYFAQGLKKRIWLHIGTGIGLMLIGSGMLLLVLLINVGGRLLAGDGGGVGAVIALLQFVVLNLYSVFYLATMTALMERMRPERSAA